MNTFDIISNSWWGGGDFYDCIWFYTGDF